MKTIKNNIKLSIIVLNYKNPELTLKCLNLLIKELDKSKISREIILVDNSSLESGDFFEKHLSMDASNITLIKNKKNLGFATANNQGIRISKGEYILLLNNDIFIKNGKVISKGLDYFESHKDTGIWSPALLNKNKIIQKTTGKKPSLLGLIHEYYLFNIFDKYKDFKRITNVDTVIGAFWLIHSSTVKKIGLLDEDYFFTSEDIDYCNRINEEGLKIIYDPDIRGVVHLGGASQTWDWLRDPYLHKSRMLYFKKNRNYISFILSKYIIKSGLYYRKAITKVRNNK